MVFVTQTGARYHASTDKRCLENASGTLAVPLETAVAGGLRPCVTCDAPAVPESTEGDRQWLRAIDDWARAGVFESFWEQAFARRVLASTPGISSDDVEPQGYISVGTETYKVDFSVPKAGLVIEVDGYAKDGVPLTASDVERRNRRDAALQTRGLTVLHFSNAQVQQEPLACRAQIAAAIDAKVAGAATPIAEPVPQTGDTAPLSGNMATTSTRRSPLGLLIGLAAAAVVVVVGVLLAVNSGSSESPAVLPPAATSTNPVPPSEGSAPPLAGGACPAGYPIKGNINKAGDRIAHSPGQKFYDKTDAEECFTDLAGAVTGGFTPARSAVASAAAKTPATPKAPVTPTAPATPSESAVPAPTSEGSAAPLAGGACPVEYPIKGNVNTAGVRIAHSPGQQFYDKTIAEACFTNVATADAGGFRPAQGASTPTTPATPAESAVPAPTNESSAAPLAGGACPVGFAIKGNISKAGDRIAHSPGQQFYDKTDAEACFADLATAEAGGFRASQR